MRHPLKIASRAAVYLILSVMSFISIFPFLWMIVGATNTTDDIIKGKWTPGSALAANFGRFFETIDVALVLLNSLSIALITTVLSIAICSLAGYGFEVFRSPARERVYRLIILTLAIPFAALLIPLFMMMAAAGILNTRFAVILPGIATGFVVFFFRQNTKAFPSELRDAARMDGLKEWQIFLSIYMPVMRSTFAAAFVIVFFTAWNSYLWPLVVLQTNEMKTIVLVVSAQVSAYYPEFGVVMVAAIFATVPTLAIFFLMQRQFVEGLTGSIK